MYSLPRGSYRILRGGGGGGGGGFQVSPPPNPCSATMDPSHSATGRRLWDKLFDHLFLFLQCQQNMARAVATEESLGIEYDEQTACDICRDVSHRVM